MEDWSEASKEVILNDLLDLFSKEKKRKGLVAIVRAVDAYISELKQRAGCKNTLKGRLLNG